MRRPDRPYHRPRPPPEAVRPPQSCPRPSWPFGLYGLQSMRSPAGDVRGSLVSIALAGLDDAELTRYVAMTYPRFQLQNFDEACESLAVLMTVDKRPIPRLVVLD